MSKMATKTEVLRHKIAREVFGEFDDGDGIREYPTWEIFEKCLEQHKQIKELQHRLSNCIEPKFKVGQELYWVYTSNQRFPFKVKVLGFVIKDLGGIRQNFYEIEENEIDMGCYNEKQLFATEEEARKHLEELKNG